ncbi:FAD-dependent oxidoreductase [Rubripirellula amarantea]|uniref:FAD-dependent oxidoreductase n=1 Tax=Rubripirellula amarantea TaxID=2527999 RepID=UPI001F5FCC5B|nr:FAD-dependent oxidoreductase [Rubripirellula amarantea]MDA8744552.1 FAD-dependent oxidoreductase [Rubripirellula amarantea]
MPLSLRERVRWTVPPDNAMEGKSDARREDPAVSGTFVLYWMHNALRAHENPALDVAICWARQNNLPLFVYHALSEDYPFASDRFHSFLLQGQRDVQRELADRGITAYFHLEHGQQRGPHLRDLTRQAKVLVTEEMPVHPVAGWIERLACRTETPIAMVDASCIVPMPLVDRSYDCPVAYQEATSDLLADRIAAPYSEQVVGCEIYRGSLPFEPLDLQDACLASLIRKCRVDHSIAPVIDTPGGTRAGYTRWNRFKASNLSEYAEQRKDASSIDGVSRMSAYLHFGMVSPFRIAREAHDAGAHQFIDRLIIWREMSFHFCNHRLEDIETMDALPQWARESLRSHATDPRYHHLSWETLSRARSSYEYWDTCQRSLIRHGELHPRLRTDWAKAILAMVATPGAAIRMAMDLNHRYALDGRDPCGYAGVLACFGQFDRPTEHERPIFGAIRNDSSHEITEDPSWDSVQTVVARPNTVSDTRVAVIGAGIGGLMAARTLMDHGIDVTVFEKSRGVGGRTATRRVQDVEGLTFDHGAQYFTAKDRRFCRYVHSWIHDGVVQPWLGRIVELKVGGEIVSEKHSTSRYVGVPTMSSIARHLADELPIHFETRIVKMERTADDDWLLRDANGDTQGPFDKVICNCPPLQTLELIDGHSAMASTVKEVRMNPTWSMMFYADGLQNIDFDAAFINEGPLSWIAKNNSKPRRMPEQGQSWVVHASNDWTASNLELTRDEAQTQLLAAFAEATGHSPENIRYITAHRWLYAIPENPITEDCLWDSAAGIAACGDWCGGPRIEGAFLSGMAAAGVVLRDLTIDRKPTYELALR